MAFKGRILHLRHSEVQLISNALSLVYTEKLRMLKANINTMTEDEKNALRDSMNKYIDLNMEIVDGKKDI